MPGKKSTFCAACWAWREVKPAISGYMPTRSFAQAALGEFLFARIGDEKSGMTLSVVSAFARLDIDPWTEAARLAGLPRAAAAATLAGMIDRIYVGAAPVPGAASIAARLVKLLPDRATAAALASGRYAPDSVAAPWSRVTPWRICAVLGAAFAVAYYFIR